MAHGNNLIKKINLLGNVYEICDANAIHSIDDLVNLGLDGVFRYVGVVAKVSDLPATAEVGNVYHVTETDSEYVWVDAIEATGEAAHWEEFGTHIVVDHIHNVSGNVNVAGTNAPSNVSGSGLVNVPKVSKESSYAKVSTSNDSFIKSYSGATSNLVTTSIVPAGEATSVVAGIVPTTASITGVNGSTTASNVVNPGSASTWSFDVEDGVLSIFGANSTAPTFESVAVPVAASAQTVVTEVSTSNANVATVGSQITVATGALDSNGTGSAVMTGLGDASTGNALISAMLAEATTADGVAVGDRVTIDSEDKTVNISGTAEAQVWTLTSGTFSGETGKP